jgi:CubicO group peptidase (beta-lactamase class C family)
VETDLTARLKADDPGLVVLVARNGKLLFSRGYGLADRENQIPIAAKTRFRIGSVTKQFTAAAIQRLAHRGKLSIDDRLSQYFPGFPGGESITLRHLLTHTSGLSDYRKRPDTMGDSRWAPITDSDLVARLRDMPPDFAPGAEYQYSNTNYVLLGQIVSMVSGEPLADYLQRHFFTPLELHDTGVSPSRMPLKRGAKGYSAKSGGKYIK